MGAFGAAKGVGGIDGGTTIGHAFNRFTEAFQIGTDARVFGSQLMGMPVDSSCINAGNGCINDGKPHQGFDYIRHYEDGSKDTIKRN